MVIPDLVLFVNGVPLVVMEAKSPSLLDVWKSQAVRQLRRYQEAGLEWHGSGAPELFHYNLLCVAHCGAAAAYATLGAPENAYFEWKSVLPYTEDEVQQRFRVEPQGQAQLIVGLLSPATLLDILRDYVVYEPERGRLVKKLPRYQQYRAVCAALGRLLSGRKPEERGGVVWHTQGSGKSLTMLWLATKVRRESRLANATIVVVTDRRQLDQQIANTFERCGFPAPERMDRSRPEPLERRARRRMQRPGQRDPLDLQSVLKLGGSRTVMTTIQKFEEALTAPEGELDMLNASENVIVMVDEAHRTQYGILGGRMSKALPNAVMVGFTGTPIEKDFKRSTIGRFGPLIDAYTIPQSVADGATVPIWYEARLPELAVEGPETLDRLYEAMFGDEPPAVQAQIRRRYANKETVAEAERRIEIIALDIAEHFKGKVRPNGFKAQVVAPSRAAALRYAERLNSFGLRAYPVITAAPNDGPEFKAARELDQEQVVNAFVDPEGEPEALVVVDMLLTGFDAPVEQALYLDRALREHGLLQAIARVNRRFSMSRTGCPPRRHTASSSTTTAYPGTLRRRSRRSTGRTYRTRCGKWTRTRRRSSRRPPSRRSPTSRAATRATLGRASASSRRTPRPRATSRPICSSGSTQTTAGPPSSWTASCPTREHWTTRTGSLGLRRYGPMSGLNSFARTPTRTGPRSGRR